MQLRVRQIFGRDGKQLADVAQNASSFLLLLFAESDLPLCRARGCHSLANRSAMGNQLGENA